MRKKKKKSFQPWKIKRGHEFTALIRRSGVKKSAKLYKRIKKVKED